MVRALLVFSAGALMICVSVWKKGPVSAASMSGETDDRTQEIEQGAGVLWPLALRGIELFAYVNNHFAGHSPQSARELQRALRLTPVDPDVLTPRQRCHPARASSSLA